MGYFYVIVFFGCGSCFEGFFLELRIFFFDFLLFVVIIVGMVILLKVNNYISINCLVLDRFKV